MNEGGQIAKQSGMKALLSRGGTTGVPAADRAPGEPPCSSSLDKLLFSFVLALCAGCTDEQTLSADQALDNMLSAISTERAREAVQSLTATAEGMGPQGAFETTVTSIPPDTVYFRQASERGITEIWSTSELTWGGDVGEEYEAMTPQVREFVRGHEFHLMLINVRTRFSDFELQERVRRAPADCLQISMKDEMGESASLCIRVDTWLPEELRLKPAGGPVQAVFSDWRETDGLNLFHAVEIKEEQERMFTYDFVDISVNTFAYEMRIPMPELPRVQKGAPE